MTASLRTRLLAGILLPVAAVIGVNSVSLYRDSLAAATVAYDRTLLASAKTIGEQLDVEGYDEQALLRSVVPYSALEAFEADNQSHMYYRVSALDGEMVSGFADLPFWRGRLPMQAALRVAGRLLRRHVPRPAGARRRAAAAGGERARARHGGGAGGRDAGAARDAGAQPADRHALAPARAAGRDRGGDGDRRAARDAAGAASGRGDRARAPPTTSRRWRRPMRRANCDR